jgi:hypothetical protein
VGWFAGLTLEKTACYSSVGLVYLVYLVCLVYLVEPEEPDEPDRPFAYLTGAYS